MQKKNCAPGSDLCYNVAASKADNVFSKVESGTTIGGVETLLIRKAKEFSTMDYIYVTDKQNVLLGVLSIKEILRTSKDAKVDEVMKKELVVAHRFTHQERLVYLALSHNLKAIPIVDDDRRLVGIVPFDVILHIFNEEMHEEHVQIRGHIPQSRKRAYDGEVSCSPDDKEQASWMIIGWPGAYSRHPLCQGSRAFWRAS